MNPLNENLLLKPADQQIDPDEWPCYVLKDAIVYRKDGKTPTNLLHTELEGPFILRGQLKVSKEQKANRKSYSSTSTRDGGTDAFKFSSQMHQVKLSRLRRLKNFLLMIAHQYGPKGSLDGSSFDQLPFTNRYMRKWLKASSCIIFLLIHTLPQESTRSRQKLQNTWMWANCSILWVIHLLYLRFADNSFLSSRSKNISQNWIETRSPSCSGITAPFFFR
jgi:hypothetical protein